ncbi:MAG TPA: putative hydroxymethylpyrimidine transporter CytX [Actinomycetota bacterium]|nr:putative hydroxymethylpyrimidine transporter CytX [Actinomycetota bacterium]
MASLTERLERVAAREAPSWGIHPVPSDRRTLSGLDLAVLWGDLSVGLLVMVTGALLVPALGLPRALLAITIGSAVGCLPLALVALAGEREGVPTMVLFRPVLGLRGSFLPSALNLLQLVGWTAVEFWAMAKVANVASIDLFGFDAYHGWLVVVALVATALAAGGPILVVRRWLERFGIYVLVGTAVWITARVLSSADMAALWRAPGQGGLPFWLGVDLVIVMPVSWLPLAADYNRFARSRAGGLAGTYWGYLVGNVWFYALGVLLVLATGATADVFGIGSAIGAVAGGGFLLIALLVGESDNAFADIYSSALSVQNVAQRVPQRALVTAVGAVGLLLALVLSVDRYQVFLLLIGSVFVPLAGVFLADYFVLRRGRYGRERLFEPSGTRWWAIVPWAVGFVLYHWSVPTGPGGWVDAMHTIFATWLHLPFPLLGSRIGASVPSFAVAFLLSLAVLGPATRSRLSTSGVGPPPAR